MERTEKKELLTKIMQLQDRLSDMDQDLRIRDKALEKLT